MLRNLGIFERALWLSDQHATFNVVSILRLDNAPVPDIVQHALGVLQKRHPLLQACIKDGKFVRLSHPSRSFKITQQDANSNWLNVVEHEMNTRLNPESGLLRGS